MLHTLSLQSHPNVHSPSFWSFSPIKQEYVRPTSDNYMKSCLPPTQCWIIGDVIEDIYSLCLLHMYLITTPKILKEEGAGRLLIFLFPSCSLYCGFHAWNWCSCPFTPFLPTSSCQMYKYTVTWNASWSGLREKEPVLPHKYAMDCRVYRHCDGSRLERKAGKIEERHCKRLGQPLTPGREVADDVFFNILKRGTMLYSKSIELLQGAFLLI